MSTDGVTGSNQTGETQATEQTEGQQKPAGSPSKPMSGSSTVGNLDKLRKESPEVYKKMLEAMFQEIQKQDQRYQKRIKEINKKSGS
jgi:hypothetical protein